MTTGPDYLAMSMPASPATAGLARTLTKTHLYKWGVIHILDDAFLIVSELITNAVNETPGEEIRFRLNRNVSYVVVAVWDSSPRTPCARRPLGPAPDALDPSPEHWDDDGGWGLPIVAALAADYGCKRDPRGGKWVWARLRH
jgi:hypothetical protein